MAPAHNSPVAGGDDLLNLECSFARCVEELPKERADCCRALVTVAVWRQCALEDAVVGHGGYHCVDIVAVHRRVEPLNGGEDGGEVSRQLLPRRLRAVPFVRL